MFDWATGSSLNRLMDGGVPGAAYDPWVEGWMAARACHGWDFKPPFAALDVPLGFGARPHLDLLRQGGASVTTATPDSLGKFTPRFDLVSVLSYERAARLAPIDFGKPFAFADLLLNAARLLNPGGTLLWSYLYAYPLDPDDVSDPLEPAALFHLLARHGYAAAIPTRPPAERLRMLHAGDTIFVAQKEVLDHRETYRKVVRVFSAVYRPGPQGPSLRWAENIPAPAPAPRPPAEPGGRQLLRMLARKVLRKARRMIPGGAKHV